MADKLDTESRIQQDCIRYFRNMYCLKHHNPQMVMFSVPNEGKDLREQLIEELAWDNEEDERDYPLHTFSLKALLSLGDYFIELKWG